MSKTTKTFAEIVEQLTDLGDKEFAEAIKTAKQFRKAQATLARAVERQQRSRLSAKSTANYETKGALEYELA